MEMEKEHEAQVSDPSVLSMLALLTGLSLLLGAAVFLIFSVTQVFQ